jgi:hypothetical protein
MFRLAEFRLQILQSHQLLILFLVEVEDDIVVELSLLVVFYIEFSFFKTGFNVVLVELPIHNLVIADDGLNDDDFDADGIFDIIILVLFDGHVKG